jgi:dihydroflavonol-4-reductase
MARILITGIGGFIGKHVAREFLAAGHDVRGTLREPGRAAALEKLLAPHAAGGGRLSFAVADLLADAGWEAAMADRDAVIHMASPFPRKMPQDESDLIRPAVEGTLRVMQAARRAGVGRFVQTSSTVAVSFGHGAGNHRFTADDWTVLDGPGTSAYARSKTLAERAARNFVAEKAPGMHFTSINPGLVWGPLMDGDYGTSVDYIRLLVTGAYPALPRIQMVAVDVRDVALMHRLAVERQLPSGGRYLAVAGAPYLAEIGRALKAGLGADGRKVPTRQLPDLVVRAAALVDRTLKEAARLLGSQVSFDASASERDLGVRFRPALEAALATGRSLFEQGIVRRS